MNLGPWEFLIIGVVIVLLFGARKMPQMARSLGQSMRILKAETKGLREDDDAHDKKDEPVAKSEPQQLPKAQPQGPQIAPPIEQTQANKNAR